MKKLVVSIVVIFYGLIVPLPANSALLDLTYLPWNFNARISEGAIAGQTVFDNSFLIFEEQAPSGGGGAFLEGQIFWDTNGSTVAVTNFVGELFTDEQFTLLGNTTGVLSIFQGIIAEDGELLIGQLEGVGGSNLQGLFWATPVDLPPSGMLMLFSLGWLLITAGVRLRHH